MKKFLLIFGYFVLFLVCTGTMFKLMHWPGAGALLVLGMSFLASFYVPIFFIQRMVENKSGLNIAVNLFGLLSISCIFTGVMFKVMHWPGAGPMIVLGTLFFVGPTLILYIIQQLKEYDKKFSEFWRTVFLVVFVSIFFFVFGMSYSRNILETYLKIEDEVLVTNENTKTLNGLLLMNIKYRVEHSEEKARPFIDIAMAVEMKSKEMINNIEQLKAEIIGHVAHMPADTTQSHWAILAKDNYDIPTHVLGMPDSPEGIKLEESLKSFNADIAGIVGSVSGGTKESFKGVNLNSKMNFEGETNVSWHESMFYLTPLVGTVTLLTSIQNEVLNTETKALLILSSTLK